NPTPKCIVTNVACSFSTITIPPRLIWTNARHAAITEEIRMGLGVLLGTRKMDIMVKNMSSEVVTATVL
ncbi:MAG TPA: hypothetical protein VM682_05635, partial [Bacillus sp. (in: firmicutes)]|nr:hypothetical protein [Bacillus sp. (in: firmicutes)]